MSVTALVMTDGRAECLARALASVTTDVAGVGRTVIHDDSGDPAHHAALVAEHAPKGWAVIGGGPRRGFGGAIANAWSWLLAFDDAEHVLHWEDDFVAIRPVPLAAMAARLDADPDLAQIALLRQPWSAEEKTAGGVLHHHGAENFTPLDGVLEHRAYFTTNPCLYRRCLMARGWPGGPNSEGRFGIDLLADPNTHCGYWGHGEQWVEHLGTVRAGTGY